MPVGPTATVQIKKWRTDMRIIGSAQTIKPTKFSHNRYLRAVVFHWLDG